MFDIYVTAYTTDGTSVLLWMLGFAIQLLFFSYSDMNEKEKEYMKKLNPIKLIGLGLYWPFYFGNSIIKEDIGKKYNIFGHIIIKGFMILLMLICLAASTFIYPSTFILYTFFYCMGKVKKALMFLITWKPNA